MNKIYAKISLLGILFIGLSAFTASAQQVVGDWRTVASGDWDPSAGNTTWAVCTNAAGAGTWSNQSGAAPSSSGSGARVITIRSGHTVTVDTDESIPNSSYSFVIASGGSLVFTGGNTLTTSSTGVTVSGSVNVSSGNTFTVAGPLVINGTVTKAGTMTVSGTTTVNNGGLLTISSTTTLAAGVTVNTGGTINVSGGNLTVTTGGIVNAGTVSVSATRTLTVSAGGLTNNGTVNIAANAAATISGTTTVGDGNAINIATGIPLGGILNLSGDLNLSNTGSIIGASPLAQMNFSASVPHTVLGNGTIDVPSVTAATNSTVTFNSGDEVRFMGNLNVAAGADIVCNGALRLLSNATKTASIGTLGASATVTGNLKVERYFKNRRGWRLVTAPLTSIPGDIFDQWQSNPANPGAGVELWGVGTTIAGQGLKASGAYNLRSYNSGYVNVTTTKAAMPNNAAYAMMVTGPYNSGFIGSGSAATTILTTGLPVTGNKTTTFTATAANLWGLVGNPYPCAIDFEGVFTGSSDISANSFFWTIDPNVGPYGYYVIVNRTGVNTYSTTPSAPYAAMSTPQGRYIQSGQAFFVKANTAGLKSINFTEANKTTTEANNSVAVFRTNNGDMEHMRVNLYSAAGSTPELVDGTLLNFHQSQYSNSFNDAEDFEKFTNSNENFFIWNGTKKTIVEGRELPDNGDEILLGMSNVKQQDYMLEIAPTDMAGNGMTATLVDNYLNTQQTISLTSVTNYNFVVTADPASASANRFKIVFGAAPTSVPVVAAGNASISAYPNPVKADNVNLQISNLDKGTYSISVYNTLGQLMTSQTLNHNGGSAIESVKLNTLVPGSYDVKVSDNKGNFETHCKIIKL